MTGISQSRRISTKFSRLSSKSKPSMYSIIRTRKKCWRSMPQIRNSQSSESLRNFACASRQRACSTAAAGSLSSPTPSRRSTQVKLSAPSTNSPVAARASSPPTKPSRSPNNFGVRLTPLQRLHISDQISNLSGLQRTAKSWHIFSAALNHAPQIFVVRFHSIAKSLALHQPRKPRPDFLLGACAVMANVAFLRVDLFPLRHVLSVGRLHRLSRNSRHRNDNHQDKDQNCQTNSCSLPHGT